jgi:hypothetical protein
LLYIYIYTHESSQILHGVLDLGDVGNGAQSICNHDETAYLIQLGVTPAAASELYKAGNHASKDTFH